MAGQHDGFALGLHLGTSNTVAVLRWPDGRTRPLLFDGQPILPSGVYADTDLAVAPDGRTVLVAVTSPEEKGGVWSVDAVSGKMSKLLDDAEAHHPSFSPDGREFVYAEGFHRLRFSSAKAG